MPCCPPYRDSGIKVQWSNSTKVGHTTVPCAAARSLPRPLRSSAPASEPDPNTAWRATSTSTASTTIRRSTMDVPSKERVCHVSRHAVQNVLNSHTPPRPRMGYPQNPWVRVDWNSFSWTCLGFGTVVGLLAELLRARCNSAVESGAETGSSPLVLHAPPAHTDGVGFEGFQELGVRSGSRRRRLWVLDMKSHPESGWQGD